MFVYVCDNFSQIWQNRCLSNVQRFIIECWGVFSAKSIFIRFWKKKKVGISFITSKRTRPQWREKQAMAVVRITTEVEIQSSCPGKFNPSCSTQLHRLLLHLLAGTPTLRGSNTLLGSPLAGSVLRHFCSPIPPKVELFKTTTTARRYTPSLLLGI